MPLTAPVYVGFTWNAPIAPTQRLTEAIFTVATSNAASVLAAMNANWPAVRCQTTANDFFGNDGSGRGGLGQQHSALTQDNSGTFGPFYDGTVLTGPATTFFTALKNAGLSSTAPLLVWLDSESQNFYTTYTVAQLNSIAADTRAAPLIAAVGTSNLAALTTSQQEAFDSWVAGQYDAALTLLANAIKAVFPNAFVANFNSVQISQAMQQVDGGGTPYYRSNAPAAGVSSPEVYDDLSRNVLIYDYQINGVSVNWSDPFFNLVYLLNRSRACRASNPANGFIPELANYTDTDLGEGALVPLASTPYWGDFLRHESLTSTFGGCVLDFNPFHHTQDSTFDAAMLDVLGAANGKPPQTLWTTAQIAYTPTDGVYTYVTLSDGTTLGRFTFAGATQSVTITTPDNKTFTLNRPFGQVGMWFGTSLGTPFGVPAPSGFIAFDLSTPGKPLQIAYAI